MIDETALWHFMNGLIKEPVQIGWLHPGYRCAIHAKTAIVRLSLYTIDHLSLGRHRERYYEILKFTPYIIYYGECRQIAINKLAFIYADPSASDKPYRAVIKAAARGSEIYLESTYRIQKAQVRATLARSPAIPKWQ
jgi:hypothetical protein